MKKAISILAGAMIALASSLAVAQPKTADELYKEGEKQYNLGEFTKAIEAFKGAYALEDKPAYLYNIAQSYRQLGDCKNAVFFYKRFLSLKANDTAKPLSASLKADIDNRLKELDACAKQAEAIKNKPPDENLPPDGGDTGDGDTGDTGDTGGGGPDVADTGDDGDEGDEGDEGEGDGDVSIGVTQPVEGPRIIAARLAAGGSKVGAGDLDVPIQVSFALTAGYPLALMPKLTLELGAGFTFTPVPYDKPGGETGGATLMSVLANVGVTYAITPKFAVHGDVGAGGMFFGGLDEGNPFTMDGAEATGALGMFNLRVAASAEYAVTPNFLVVATPIAFSYSPPASGLIEDISALTRIDFMLGVGYRM
jgi:hypothetical protein